MGGIVMESLAYLVVIIFMVTIFSGPFAIALTSHKLVNFLNSKEGIAWAIVNALRKIIHLLAITIGTFLGLSLLAMAVTVPKLIGIYAIVLAYIALRREYFSAFYITRYISSRIGFKSKVEPRIYSADGTEIIRAKKSSRFGRSSGRDGHGPEGQH
ncbi:MAG: hypothetical protein WCN84_02750 [Actinomycetes bacterium]|jgi:uncharacterized Tic20 family protein